jgi:predicted nuclease of predicted toxin-antitoxin system
VNVLVDDPLPWRLVKELNARGPSTIRGLGASGRQNRMEHLRRAADSGVDILLTTDQDPMIHASLAKSGLGVVVLSISDLTFEALLPIIPMLMSAISKTRRGEVVRVDA